MSLEFDRGAYHNISGRVEITPKYINLMQLEIDTLKARVKQLERPEIYWLPDCPEDGCDSPYELLSEFVDKDSVGLVIELEVAHRLPNIKVKILPFNKNGDIEIEYLEE